MMLQRRQMQVMAINLLNYAIRRTRVPLSAWPNDMCKDLLGVSKSFFYNNGRGFIETRNNGNRRINEDSFDLLSKATGIRQYDIKSKVINFDTYPFDPQAAIDFANHMANKNAGRSNYNGV